MFQINQLFSLLVAMSVFVSVCLCVCVSVFLSATLQNTLFLRSLRLLVKSRPIFAFDDTFFPLHFNDFFPFFFFLGKKTFLTEKINGMKKIFFFNTLCPKINVGQIICWPKKNVQANNFCLSIFFFILKKRNYQKKFRQNIFVCQTKCWQKKIVGRQILGKKKFWTKIFFGKIGFGAKKNKQQNKVLPKNNFGQKIRILVILFLHYHKTRTKIVSVLLSAHTEGFSVSHMRDFYLFTRLIYEDLVQWENRVVLLFITFLEEREFVEKFGRIMNLSTLFLCSMQTMQKNHT